MQNIGVEDGEWIGDQEIFLQVEPWFDEHNRLWTELASKCNLWLKFIEFEDVQWEGVYEEVEREEGFLRVGKCVQFEEGADGIFWEVSRLCEFWSASAGQKCNKSEKMNSDFLMLHFNFGIYYYFTLLISLEYLFDVRVLQKIYQTPVLPQLPVTSSSPRSNIKFKTYFTNCIPAVMLQREYTQTEEDDWTIYWCEK